MDRGVLDQLPSPIQALTAELEAFAGLELRVEQCTAPDSIAAHLATEATQATCNGATIFVHDLHAVRPQGVLHELLHIRRYWIDGVPKVVPAQPLPGHVENCNVIENALEHQVIVPLEVHYGIDSSKHWNALSRSNWSDPGLLASPDPFVRRRNGYLMWLALSVGPDEQAQNVALSLLGAANMAVAARKFGDAIWRNLKRKEVTVSITAQALGIPLGDLRLAYDDVRSRNRTLRPVPTVQWR